MESKHCIVAFYDAHWFLEGPANNKFTTRTTSLGYDDDSSYNTLVIRRSGKGEEIKEV